MSKPVQEEPLTEREQFIAALDRAYCDLSITMGEMVAAIRKWDEEHRPLPTEDRDRR